MVFRMLNDKDINTPSLYIPKIRWINSMTLKYFLNFINAIQLFRDEENKKCLQGKKSKALFVSKGKFKINKKNEKANNISPKYLATWQDI